jgi:hypothetical protein
MSNAERQARWRARQAAKHKAALAHAKRTAEIGARRLNNADALELSNLRRDLPHAQAEIRRLESYTRALEAALSIAGNRSAAGSGQFCDEQLAALIQHCHPDKWKSAHATAIAAVLLDIRKRRKAALRNDVSYT